MPAMSEPKPPSPPPSSTPDWNCFSPLAVRSFFKSFLGLFVIGGIAASNAWMTALNGNQREEQKWALLACFLGLYISLFLWRMLAGPAILPTPADLVSAGLPPVLSYIPGFNISNYEKITFYGLNAMLISNVNIGLVILDSFFPSVSVEGSSSAGGTALVTLVKQFLGIFMAGLIDSKMLKPVPGERGEHLEVSRDLAPLFAQLERLAIEKSSDKVKFLAPLVEEAIKLAIKQKEELGEKLSLDLESPVSHLIQVSQALRSPLPVETPAVKNLADKAEFRDPNKENELAHDSP